MPNSSAIFAWLDSGGLGFRNNGWRKLGCGLDARRETWDVEREDTGTEARRNCEGLSRNLSAHMQAPKVCHGVELEISGPVDERGDEPSQCCSSSYTLILTTIKSTAYTSSTASCSTFLSVGKSLSIVLVARVAMLKFKSRSRDRGPCRNLNKSLQEHRHCALL